MEIYGNNGSLRGRGTVAVTVPRVNKASRFDSSCHRRRRRRRVTCDGSTSKSMHISLCLSLGAASLSRLR